MFFIQFSRFLTIVGKHEESLQNHGYTSRHFIRRILLPSNVETTSLESNINNGILTVTAPAAILPAQSKNIEEEDYEKRIEEEVRMENPQRSVSRNNDRRKNIEHQDEKTREETLPERPKNTKKGDQKKGIE